VNQCIKTIRTSNFGQLKDEEGVNLGDEKTKQKLEAPWGDNDLLSCFQMSFMILAKYCWRSTFYGKCGMALLIFRK